MYFFGFIGRYLKRYVQKCKIVSTNALDEKYPPVLVKKCEIIKGHMVISFVWYMNSFKYKILFLFIAISPQPLFI